MGYFTTFPNLTTTLVKKYLQKSIFNAKGHLDQQYKNSRSTSKIITTPHYVDDQHVPNDLQLLPTKINVVFATITSFDNSLPTGQISTDQTGRFIVYETPTTHK